MVRQDPLHHVRHLRRLPHGEVFFRGIEVGDDAARLERRRSMARGDERRFDHMVGARKNSVHVAGIDHPLETQVVAEFGMDHRSARIERSLGIGHRRQLFPPDLDELGGILRLRAAFRDDRHHRFALPARAPERERQLRRRTHALHVQQHAHVRAAQLRDIRPRQDAQHAGRIACRVRSDTHDARMCMGAAHHDGVRESRQLQVVDVLATPRQEAQCVRTRQGRADVLHCAARRRHRPAFLHRIPPARCARHTTSTASTIAWYPVHRQ